MKPVKDEATTSHERSDGSVATDELRRLARYSGDPWQPSNPYFDRAEAGFDELWMRRIWPFIQGSDFSRCVDLAAGKGRNAAKLLEVSGELVIVDINAGLVESCRQRFQDRNGLRFEVGNGYDLSCVSDGWATFVYCFDAMVHFDSDVVRSYLRDLRRALASEGCAFLHHSNLTSAGADWTRNPKARNFMSAELFAHYAKKEGLELVKQQVIDWGDSRNIDCLSMVRKL